MNAVFALYKPLGATPLETTTSWKHAHHVANEISVGYAGRLDPMAEGVLLVLVGHENTKRKQYERLPKIYDVDILLGITTDTYDTLGIVQRINKTTIQQNNLEETLQAFVGTFEQPYPPYSSARVNGKPLFYWAREGKLEEVSIPTKSITIDYITLNSLTEISGERILTEATRRTTLVHGEFRQAETRATWEKTMVPHSQFVFSLLHLTVSCSSGTYMRSIAHELGKKIGTGAIAYRIVRTAVGPYTLSQAEQVMQRK